jgi:hypothetical protein
MADMPLSRGKKVRKDYPNVHPLDTLLPMKDVGLRIRIDRELREQFLKACKEEDKPAAQVLREFMRSYVAGRTKPSERLDVNTQMKRSKEQ